MSINYSENYQCEFVQPPDKDMTCPICMDVVINPHVTTCCKKVFCHGCLIRCNTHHCPLCRHENYCALPSEEHTRSVQLLPVYCIMQHSGCDWVGPLQDLERFHLKAKDGSCRFVVTACPDGCGQQILQQELDDHQKICPHRLHKCPHCKQVGTHRNISGSHRDACRMHPLSCPNRCGAEHIPRCQMKSHMAECPLAMVKCSFPECTQWIQRRDERLHNEKNTHKHLTQLSTAAANMTKMLEESKKSTQQINHNQQMTDLTSTHGLNQQHMDLTSIQWPQVGQRVNYQEGPPVDFVMADYDRHYRNSDWWHSPAFKTHFGGYSMYLNIRVVTPPTNQAAVQGEDERKIVMELRANDDDQNDQLVWPRRCTVTVQILNQLEDQDHHTETISGEMKKPVDMPSSRCWVTECFMPCSKVRYDPHRHTQYLKDDCLKIRIGVIRLQDTDFMF